MFQKFCKKILCIVGEAGGLEPPPDSNVDTPFLGNMRAKISQTQLLGKTHLNLLTSHTGHF
jgi:hypothetical protein